MFILGIILHMKNTRFLVRTLTLGLNVSIQTKTDFDVIKAINMIKDIRRKTLSLALAVFGG